MLTSSIKSKLCTAFLVIFEITMLILALTLPSCELKSYPFTLNHWLIIISSLGLLICLVINPSIIKIKQWLEHAKTTKFGFFITFILTMFGLSLIIFVIAWYGLGLVLLTDLIDNNYLVVKITIFRYISEFTSTLISLNIKSDQSKKSDNYSEV